MSSERLFGQSSGHQDVTTSSTANIKRQCDSISTKIPSLTSDIYRECKSLVATYGDRFLHNLMPLVVAALENLEAAQTERDELQLKLTVIKEDHRHLMNEYEREKANRKAAESNNLRLEDDIEEERKIFQSKISEMEASLRVCELKLRNTSELVTRAEERELEWNTKYNDLHGRYTALVRSYAEYAERSRWFAHQKSESRTSATNQFAPATSELRAPPMCTAVDEPYYRSHLTDSPLGDSQQIIMSRSQFDLLQAQAFETERQRIMRNIMETTPELHDTDNLPGLPDPSFDELSQADLVSEDGTDAQSFDGSTSNQQTNGGDSSSMEMFNGVTREVNNLIKENQDLVQTKNALNVVTNDLIGRIDDLTCENLRLSSERNVLVTNSTGMVLRIKELEQQCRRLRQDLENVDLRESMYTGSVHSEDSYDDSDDSETPISMRKRFSRIEMARVLLERNQYKEQLCELQDAVRWTGALKAEQSELRQRRSHDPQKRGRIWALFAKLFTPKTQENGSQQRQQQQQQQNDTHTTVIYDARSAEQEFPNAVCLNPTSLSSETATRDDFPSDQDGVVSIFESKKPRVSVHQLGPTEWLPVGQPASLNRITDFSALLRTGSHYPYTCYVRPVCEKLTMFKLWCATCTYQEKAGSATGRTNQIIPANDCLAVTNDLETTPIRRVLDTTQPDTAAMNSPNLQVTNSSEFSPTNPTWELSSTIWLCSVATGCGIPLRNVVPSEVATQQPNSVVHSVITVIDADVPQNNLDTFVITASTVLCMAAVPGYSSEDLHHLGLSSRWWNSVPLNLSEELLMEESSTGPFPVHPRPNLANLEQNTQSQLTTGDIPDSTYPQKLPAHLSKSHSCQTSCLPIYPWDDPDSLHISTASMPPGAQRTRGTPGPETMISYFVERKRFSVKNATGFFARNKTHHEWHAAVNSGSQGRMDTSMEVTTTSDSFPNHTSKITSAQPTVWLGCYNGDVFVHSSVTQWRNCLHSIRLPDSVTQIQYFNNRVFVSLANGQIVVFQRHPSSSRDSPGSASTLFLNGAVTSSNLNESDSSGAVLIQPSEPQRDPRLGAWDFTEACVITCGQSRTPVRRTIVVPITSTIWTTYRNQILVINALTLQLVNCIEIHSHGDPLIQSMCCSGDGVWVAVRKDPFIRLYDALTQRTLQTVELCPILFRWLPTLKAIPSKISSVNRRRAASAMATTLFATDEHLWIGTNLGLIITVPFESPSGSSQNSLESVSHHSRVVKSGIQVSRNQHEGPVRFIVTAHGTGPTNLSLVEASHNGHPHQHETGTESRTGITEQTLSTPIDPRVLVVSGGEGYRLLDPPRAQGHTDDNIETKSPSTCSFSKERNHLIVWKLRSQSG